jgi:HSP20 family molecular chaperone IbpA
MQNTSNVAIEKIQDPEAGAIWLTAEMESTVEAIRQKAFDYFLQRGSLHGNELDDWLRAERELVSAPHAEMSEREKEVVLQVQASGLEPKNLQITATPESILVQSEVTHKHDESNGKVHLCEFSEKMFRRFDLPAPIDVDKVSATLEKGILRIVAPKAQPAQQGRSIPVTASASA